MSNFKKLNDICFHDGLLLKYEENYSSLERSKRQISLSLALYSADDSKEREAVQLIFENVERAIKVHNFTNHEFNMGAGNLSNGYFLDDGTCMIYLCDGYIEIKSEKITLSN